MWYNVHYTSTYLYIRLCEQGKYISESELYVLRLFSLMNLDLLLEINKDMYQSVIIYYDV